MDFAYYEKRIIGIISGLPQMPFNIQQIGAALQREDMDAQKLSKLLSSDATLASKILQTVNSPAFGLFRTVSDLTWAITILGLKGVRDTLMSKQAFGLLTAGQPLSPTLKKHFVQVAETGIKICQTISRKDLSGEIYAAGLVHDFGEVLFEQAGCSSKADSLGLKHAEYGARLLEKWNFPELLVMTSRFHHNPNQAPENATLHAKILFLSECVHSKPVKEVELELIPPILESIKLSEKDFSILK